jgi:uncharacterized membrane protein YwzB
MSRAAVVAYVSGVYLGILGIVLIVSPNTLLPLFGFPASAEVWIRVVGALTASFGWYSFTAARAEDVSYFRASIIQQPALLVVFVALVLAGVAQPPLILFGVVQLVFALATWWALRSR